jgi:outer membrane protein assembly factor BamB
MPESARPTVIQELRMKTSARAPSLAGRILRVGFPQVLLAVAAFLYFGVVYGMGHDRERQWFYLFRLIVVIVAATLLGLWLIFFSGMRKKSTIPFVAGIVAIAMGCFRIEFDGDLRQTIHGRHWLLNLLGISHDDDVAAHRRQQAGTPKRAIDLTEQPDDFPGYRGADRTGVVHGPELAPDWNTSAPRELWKQPIYGGYSAFAAVNGFLFTLEQRRDQEALVCYDGRNGAELWATAWPARFEESMGGVGPRSTPTVFDGDVFALGALGKLVCVDGRSGELKWSVDTLAGNKNLRWAMSSSPLVYGDYVVVNPGTQSDRSVGSALVAYDRHTGKVARSVGKSQAGYASPMLVKLAGRVQLLLFDGAGLAGYDPVDLEELWRFPWRTNGTDGINVAQPLVIEEERAPHTIVGAIGGGLTLAPVIANKGQVFIASAYGRGGAMLHVDNDNGQWSVRELWTTGRTAMRCKFASPVYRDGFIYGLDDGNLQCVDAADGAVKWTDTRHPDEGDGFGHGQILLAGDVIVVLTQFGEIALVEARPDRFVERGRRKILAGNKTWNNPAMVDGRLYIRNHVEMAAVELPKK